MLAGLQSAQDVSETGPTPSLVQRPAASSVVVPVKASTQRVVECPSVTVITLEPKRPEAPKVNTVPQARPAAQLAPACSAQNMPNRPPSLSTAEKQHRRKLFEDIIRQQNLPHTTIEEKKHQVLMAAIAFWREYPHLHFDHVEPLLHRYLDFGASDREYLRQRLWQNRPENPSEVEYENAQKVSSNTTESHEKDSAEVCTCCR